MCYIIAVVNMKIAFREGKNYEKESVTHEKWKYEIYRIEIKFTNWNNIKSTIVFYFSEDNHYTSTKLNSTNKNKE